MFSQLLTPNPNIPCRPGYCLEYVRQAVNLPIKYGSATEAWNNSTSQHGDWNFPGNCWVPVWFAIDIEPNGHVAWHSPDGSVWSASDLTNTPHHHPDIQDLINYYAKYGKMQLTYLGWTEDVASYPVITSTEELMADQTWYDNMINAQARIDRSTNKLEQIIDSGWFRDMIQAQARIDIAASVVAPSFDRVLKAVAAIPGITPDVVAGLRQELSDELKSATSGITVTLATH